MILPLIRTYENKKLFLEDNSMEQGKKYVVEKTVKHGVSFGSVLAVVISYNAWHSIGWAIFHGLLSWFYVIYYAIRY